LTQRVELLCVNSARRSASAAANALIRIDAFQSFKLLFGVASVLPAAFHFAETSGELNRKAMYQAGEGFRPVSKYNLKAQ
jgi:hypothetical protein